MTSKVNTNPPANSFIFLNNWFIFLWNMLDELNRTILVVDDDDEGRISLAKILRKEAFNVDESSNAKEALEKELALLKAEATEAKGLTRENRRLSRRIQALEKERTAFDNKMKSLESEADVNQGLAKENKALKIQVQTLQKELEALNVRFEEIIKMAADDLKTAAQKKSRDH